MKLNNKQQRELGFKPLNNSEYEFIHWSEEVCLNVKNDTLYEFCEVDGIKQPITKVSNFQELKEIITNVLML